VCCKNQQHRAHVRSNATSFVECSRLRLPKECLLSCGPAWKIKLRTRDIRDEWWRTSTKKEVKAQKTFNKNTGISLSCFFCDVTTPFHWKLYGKTDKPLHTCSRGVTSLSWTQLLHSWKRPPTNVLRFRVAKAWEKMMLASSALTRTSIKQPLAYADVAQGFAFASFLWHKRFNSHRRFWKMLSWGTQLPCTLGHREARRGKCYGGSIRRHGETSMLVALRTTLLCLCLQTLYKHNISSHHQLSSMLWPES